MLVEKLWNDLEPLFENVGWKHDFSTNIVSYTFCIKNGFVMFLIFIAKLTFLAHSGVFRWAWLYGNRFSRFSICVIPQFAQPMPPPLPPPPPLHLNFAWFHFPMAAPGKGGRFVDDLFIIITFFFFIEFTVMVMQREIVFRIIYHLWLTVTYAFCTRTISPAQQRRTWNFERYGNTVCGVCGD